MFFYVGNVCDLYYEAMIFVTLCDTVCQRFTAGQLFSLGTLVSSSNKTDSYNISEILLKVALNTITLTLQ